MTVHLLRRQRQTITTTTMKILNTIITTRYSESYNAHVERTYSIIRPYVLTYKGAARALKNEFPDLDTSAFIITRIETAIYQ